MAIFTRTVYLLIKDNLVNKKINCSLGLLFTSLFATCVYADELIGELNDSSFYVVTPTTIEENVHDTPAATTVISGDEILRRGITRIEDIFRYVPGMSVLRGDSNTSRVAYHGTNNENPRRMLILINGKTIPYNENLQWVRWETMPFGIGDIKKIEVIRSPSNAIYGGNAAQGTINIILKEAVAGRGEVGGFYGSQDTGEVNLRANILKNERASIYFSAGHRQSQGYDEDFISAEDRLFGSTPFDGELTIENEWTKAHDDYDVNYISLSSDIYLGDNTRLEVLTGYSEFDNSNRTVNVSFEFVEQNDPDHSIETDLTGKQFYITANLDHIIDETKEIELYVSGSRHEDVDEWNDCRDFNLSYWDESYNLYEFGGVPFVNRVYFPTLRQQFDPSTLTNEELAVWGPWAARIGADPAAAFSRDICADWRLGVVADRATIQGLFKWAPHDSTKLVIGGGAKHYDLDSQTLYGGSVREDRYNLLFNLTNFAGPVTSHLGLYAEHFSLNDDVYFSPRLAINYRFSDFHSVKVIHAISHSDPPILAREAQWQFDNSFSRSGNGATEGTFFWHVFGDSDVEAEKITSTSLVFVGKSRTNPFSYDLKVFKEDLDNLIPALFDIFTWNPSNSSSAEQKGVEMTFRWNDVDNNSIGVTASYIDNDTDTEVEQSLHSQWIVGSHATYKLADATFLTLQYNRNEIAEVEYDELSLNLNTDILLGDSVLTLGGNMTYYFQDQHLKFYKRPINQEYRAFYTRYDDRLHTSLSAVLKF